MDHKVGVIRRRSSVEGAYPRLTETNRTIQPDRSIDEPLPTAGVDRSAADITGGQAISTAAYTLARRLAAGATLWCVSPAWPEHARHVAVEFVHPVIVGTRALPSVAVSGPDPVASVRAVARAGDVVLAVSRADDAVVADLFKRTPAWGATSLWLAAGSAPATAHADLVVRIDDPDGSAPFDGRLVLQYHLLWELTHVCFEHPGLLRDDPADAGEVCTTCRDEGRLGEVLATPTEATDVQVRTSQGIETVDTSLVGRVERNDLVLVHAGAAITAVDP